MFFLTRQSLIRNSKVFANSVSGNARLACQKRADHAYGQRTNLPGLFSSNWGSLTEQSGFAMGHRVWNVHPDGGLDGDGTSPSKMILEAFFFRTMDGTADNSALE